MTEEKLNECLELILESIPQGSNVTGIKLIQSYEALERKLTKKEPYLWEIAEETLEHKLDEDKVDTIDQYFKAVHKAIRAKVKKKSSLLDNALQVILLENYKNGKGLLFTKEEGFLALEKVFDYYDPNVNQDFLQQTDNWAGFWSLVTTDNGAVIEVKLSDASDREMFYEALEVIQAEAYEEKTVEEVPAPVVHSVAKKSKKEIKKERKEKNRAQKGVFYGN